MPRTAVVVGTGSYAPNNIVTNEDIIKKFENARIPMGKDKTVSGREYIEGMASKVGYKTRRKIGKSDETTATMCVEAGKRALTDAGLKPEDIDLIILATDSPDFISPPTSSRIQFELGAKNAAFFDINAACAGYTIALSNAWQQIKGDPTLKYVMVLGGYGMSKYSDPDDILTEFMFADGAGALILKSVEDSQYGIQASSMQGNGMYWDYMGIYGGGTWKGFSEEVTSKRLQYVKFLKGFPATVNIEAWPALIKKSLEKAKWTTKDVDLAFFTQVNLAVINEVCSILGWDPKISHNIMDVYGYTGSACIPMAIDDANKKGLLKAGQKISICTSGGGAAFATMALTWGK